MSWYIEVVEYPSPEMGDNERFKVAKTLGPFSGESMADRADRGMNRNMDHDRFFTRIVERDAPRVVVDHDYAGHGKFSSNVDEWLYGKALEGWGTESFGEAEYGGHHELMEFDPDDPFVVVNESKQGKYQAAILVIDSKGFVHVSLYDDLKEARKDWEKAQKESEQEDG